MAREVGGLADCGISNRLKTTNRRYACVRWNRAKEPIMSATATKRKPYQKGLRADYQGATPEEVARAMIRSAPRLPSTVVENATNPSNPVRDFVKRMWRSLLLREERA